MKLYFKGSEKDAPFSNLKYTVDYNLNDSGYSLPGAQIAVSEVGAPSKAGKKRKNALLPNSNRFESKEIIASKNNKSGNHQSHKYDFKEHWKITKFFKIPKFFRKKNLFEQHDAFVRKNKRRGPLKWWQKWWGKSKSVAANQAKIDNDIMKMTSNIINDDDVDSTINVENILVKHTENCHESNHFKNIEKDGILSESIPDEWLHQSLNQSIKKHMDAIDESQGHKMGSTAKKLIDAETDERLDGMSLQDKISLNKSLSMNSSLPSNNKESFGSRSSPDFHHSNGNKHKTAIPYHKNGNVINKTTKQQDNIKDDNSPDSHLDTTIQV
ncbi:MAG: hypothetical protein GY821_13200 [Gammaproteobacteria bacterium]|nr:hypothetical protein [Gammaproteobacteria bacterium]